MKGRILRMAKLQRSAVRLCVHDDVPQQTVAETPGITPGHPRVDFELNRVHFAKNVADAGLFDGRGASSERRAAGPLHTSATPVEQSPTEPLTS